MVESLYNWKVNAVNINLSIGQGVDICYRRSGLKVITGSMFSEKRELFIFNIAE